MMWQNFHVSVAWVTKTIFYCLIKNKWMTKQSYEWYYLIYSNEWKYQAMIHERYFIWLEAG